MDSVLIITSTEKSDAVNAASIADMFRAHNVFDVVHARTGDEGRSILVDRVFDVVCISAPLSGESGENLARQIAISEISQVILAVKSEIYDQVCSVCGKDGVFIIAKPINKEIFNQLINLIKTMCAKLKRVKSENESLKQKIDNIRITDRAKNILIASCKMSENEAHRYIEKKAMDTRTSKRTVSEKIIYDYENGDSYAKRR